MYAFSDQLTSELTEIKDAGLWKAERELTSPQSAHVTTKKAEALPTEVTQVVDVTLEEDMRILEERPDGTTELPLQVWTGRVPAGG